MTDLEIIGSAERTLEDLVDTAVGGAALALEPVRRPRATARSARRRGAQVTDEVVEQIETTAGTVVNLPERLLHQGLRRVRQETRREDIVGAAARAVLQGVNVPAANAAGFFARLERETEIPKPARRGRAASSSTTSRRRTTGATSRGTRGANARGRSTAQRGGRGRTAARRSA